MTELVTTVGNADILGALEVGFERVLTEEAVAFTSRLVRQFRPTLQACLSTRAAKQALFDRGVTPDFLPDTQHIRDGLWTIRGIPADLRDRRVEITGPVERKMVINALNAPVQCYMADFEDSLAPTWQAVIQGQLNLMDAVAGTIEHTDPATGKQYRLNDPPATLIVRPRGWHLMEKHMLVDGAPAPAAIVDFALYFFHNARALIKRGTGPYFYLPKLESHLEARLWNDVFIAAQDALGMNRGTIKATVLIETLPAAFEMDEILYELRDHVVGLNCGRWDYIFSMIKTLKLQPGRVMADRFAVDMAQPCMDSYSKLLCQTCHKRGALAIGGMSPFIPVKNDPAANDKAFGRVRADKQREVDNGHDGAWVAHPGLASVVRDVFDAGLPGANQLERPLNWPVTADDLLRQPEGPMTEAGLRNNISVALQYIEAWITGQGCVPLYNLMEDAATAEISRAQVWQWIHHPEGQLDDGRQITIELVTQVLAEELDIIRVEVGDERYESGRFSEARDLLFQLCMADELEDFFTVPAYELLP
ncbi:MAG: malate synthase A [Abyssibacter sp.]|uniref:malate synthase A n=1 Tax=Abyssibacter sp. TaxID=2320200 RepID=UPI00321BF5E7